MFANELWMIYALVFGAVLLAVQGLYLIAFKGRRENAAINRRLVLTAELNNPSEVLEALRRERGISILAHNEALQGLNTLIVQSGTTYGALSLVLIVVILSLLFYVALAFAAGLPLLLALVLAPLLGIGALYGYLRLGQSRRIAAFGEQFPDAIDVIVRGLRAGHPFRVALGLVAREMPDPIGSEFGIVADEIMFGLDQGVAIDNLNKRVGHADLLFFGTAITVQQQTGGNLAEILTRLSRLLRSRSKLRLKIRALSSEGRMSAIALSLAPLVLFGIISLISPDYFGAVRNHPIIPFALALGLFLLAVGNVVLYRMVNFKF